jgi:hypothetical protein
VFLEYNGGGRLCLQVSNLPLLFDMDKYEDPLNGTKYSALLSLRDADKSPYVAQLRDVLAALDAATLDAALASSVEWLGKKYTNLEVLAENYQRTLSEPVVKGDASGKTHPPRMKVKLMQREGAFETEIYNEKRERVDPGAGAGDATMTVESVFKRGAVVTAILECTGVWIVDKKFGLSWRVAQVVAKKRAAASSLVAGHAAFVNDEGVPMPTDEDDEMGGTAGAGSPGLAARTPPPPAPPAAAAPAPVVAPPAAAEAMDEDEAEGEEEEEDDGEAEIVPPAPVAKPAPVAAKPVAAVAAKPKPVVRKK